MLTEERGRRDADENSWGQGKFRVLEGGGSRVANFSTIICHKPLWCVWGCGGVVGHSVIERREGTEPGNTESQPQRKGKDVIWSWGEKCHSELWVIGSGILKES